MTVTRRAFFAGLAAVVAAPAIVHYASIMPVKQMPELKHLQMLYNRMKWWESETIQFAMGVAAGAADAFGLTYYHDKHSDAALEWAKKWGEFAAAVPPEPKIKPWTAPFCPVPPSNEVLIPKWPENRLLRINDDGNLTPQRLPWPDRVIRDAGDRARLLLDAGQGTVAGAAAAAADARAGVGGTGVDNPAGVSAANLRTDI